MKSQGVANRNCPESYFRNNGNGQKVEVFASNIDPNGIYAQSALTSGNKGNFTFKWGTPIENPPVVNKTWITNEGVVDQNWVFGDNSTGSPFNPPGVPDAGDVQYTFYNSNLPTAGTITIEFIDPFDGSFVNTCSYILSSGGSSEGGKVSQAIAPPSDFYYTVDTAFTEVGTTGVSDVPEINSGGGTIVFSIESGDANISIDESTGEISWNQNLILGTYEVVVRASNGLSPDAFTNYTVEVVESGVSSGNDGGLESESLGDAVAERNYDRSLSGKSRFNYNKNEELNGVLKSDNESGMLNWIPSAEILGEGFKSYLTSPQDIIAFTNAEEVVSVDYVKKGVNKGVVFCVKSLGDVYSHTKPVCDRLKGRSLRNIEKVEIEKFQFLQYVLHNKNGVTEYAISFVVGFNAEEQKMNIQTHWLNKNYTRNDVMYNFQIWSSDPMVIEKIMVSIITQLKMENEVVQETSPYLPIMYISELERKVNNQLMVEVLLMNNSNERSAILEIKGKENEQTDFSSYQEIEIDLNPYQINAIDLNLADIAEAEITLKVGEKTEDFVYINDGIWNLYQTPGTIIQDFDITNDNIIPNDEEYRLFRNVSLKAISSNYLTVYRMLKGNGEPKDLTNYNTLNFTASGQGKVTIRLIKASIKNYNEQYTYELTLMGENIEYAIDFSDFISSNTNLNKEFDDVSILSFTYEVSSEDQEIEASLNNVRFSNAEQESNIFNIEELEIFPNPVQDKFNYTLYSNTKERYKVQILQLGKGSVVYSSSVVAQKGKNVFKMDLNALLSPGVYVLILRSQNQSFSTKFTIVK